MPKDVDLGPDDYSVRSKSGRWVKRDATYMLPLAFMVAALVIGYGWWHRAEIPIALLFAVACAAAFAFGCVIGAWLKRFD